MTLVLVVGLVGCKKSAKTVLISGDSWGYFTCVGGSMDKALRGAGIEDASANYDCSVTTQVGMRAENWLMSKYDKNTMDRLKDSSVRVLYFNLGGNDVLNQWNKNLSASDEAIAFDKVVLKLKEVVQIYQSVRPDVKILITGYDYPRFTANHPIDEYR